MTLRAPLLRSWSVMLLGLLAACSSIQPVDLDDPDALRLYQAKHDQLAGQDHWTLLGRLAVRNEADGGSGSFAWEYSAGSSRMDFHGALGRGAWRLTAEEGGALLELADGTIHRADSVDDLVRQQLGWEIPVDKLSWWVRGLAAPGGYQQRSIDQRGDLRELNQGGWHVEYGKYRSVGSTRLPVKLIASQADWKVKLAVRGWDLANGATGHE